MPLSGSRAARPKASEPNEGGLRFRKQGFTRGKDQLLRNRDIPISSDHVGTQVKRENQASAGFLATLRPHEDKETPNTERKVSK